MLAPANAYPHLSAPPANDNARRPITSFEPIEPGRTVTADPFDGDVDAWLTWLSDCTVIESSIRRGLDCAPGVERAPGLDALGAGPDAWNDPARRR